jgi:hypothetical protein
VAPRGPQENEEDDWWPGTKEAGSDWKAELGRVHKVQSKVQRTTGAHAGMMGGSPKLCGFAGWLICSSHRPRRAAPDHAWDAGQGGEFCSRGRTCSRGND